MDELVFKTILKEVSVTIDEQTYKVRELDGIGLKKHRQDLGGDVSVGENGKPIITNINLEDPEVCLLSNCLFGPGDKLVPLATIQKWPSTVIEKLYGIAQELSGLNVKARKRLEEEAKNS